MTNNRTFAKLAPAMMALPVIVGAPLCYLRPDRDWLWIFSMLVLPVAWFGIRRMSKTIGRTTVGALITASANPDDAQKATSSAIVIASLIIGIALGAKLADAMRWIDPSLAHAILTRWINVLAGCYFVFRGNHLPKVLTPLADIRCDPAAMQTLQRRTGWTYVLGGVAFAGVWLLLPQRLAQPIGIAIVVVGILVPTFIMRYYASRRTELLSL
ncbi:MAG TPA: hypothetical protein VGM97_13415 [Steroidobacteraceae bacterium]|jgi:hypothetical protein